MFLNKMLKKVKSSKNSRGFTLIELLVVIILIMILSGVVIGVLNSSGIRAKSRDSQRKSDLKKVQVALEAYFADNRSYPTTSNAWVTVDSTTNNTVTSSLSPNYIQKLPTDPTNTGSSNPCTPNSYKYLYRSNGSTYDIGTNMEVASSAADSTCSSNAINCFARNDACYSVKNP